MNKALIITSVASMVDQFLISSIVMLRDMGCTVEVACNFETGSTCSKERIENLKDRLSSLGVKYYHIDFSRNILRLSKHVRAYKQVKQIIKNGKYDLVHCHSPIGGLIARLACRKARKNGLRVIYTAHGFHFYKGAPKKNWLLYYPVEKFCAPMTDVLITINKEDYAFAQKKLKAGRIEYVPGVGIDVAKFAETQVDVAEKRREIGVPEDAFLLLSVGELNRNKNHETVIRAVASLQDPHIHYAIAGIGGLHDYLAELATSLGVGDQIHLLGYRKDVAELYKVADAYAHPSLREGLPVALMEAMASGLPCIASRIRGNVDLITEGVGGYLCAPTDAGEYASAIRALCENPEAREIMRKNNLEKIQEYDISVVQKEM